MIDLETIIREWKKEFKKYESFEDGLILDLEQHLRDEINDLTQTGHSEEDAFRIAVLRIGSAESMAREFSKNRELALDRRRPWRPARFIPALLWNYIKTALRKLGRQKGYSFINISGLAIGMTCFILLMMWIQAEINWDRFHKNYKTIYRVQSGLVVQPGAVGPYLKENYPEIVNSVRLYYGKSRSIRYKDRVLEEKGFVFADPSIFEIFTIPFVSGNPRTAFSEPDSAVLTENASRKYFGDENPLGRILIVDNQFHVRITGVVENPPGNSDIQFEVLVEFNFIKNYIRNPDTNWGAHNYFTYIQLEENTDYRSVITKIAPGRRVMDDEPSAWLLTLKPLDQIHLYEDGNIKAVAIFALVAVFILIIAGCNFINLTTAKSGQRAREISIRKVVGATRIQLIKQFLSESTLLSLCALMMALLIISLILPSFNALTQRDFHLEDILAKEFFLFILAITLFVGLAAGAYPAIIISSFNPAGFFLKKGSNANRFSTGFNLRKALVFIQFAISVGLMISMLLVQKQISYIHGHDLGISKENLIILPLKESIVRNRDSFINELTSQSGIINATFASSFPSNTCQVTGVEWEGKDSDLDPVWQFIETDEHYIDTLGITLIEGRNFPKSSSIKKVDPNFIVNQRAVTEMGVRDPVGTKFSTYNSQGKIIGVIKDFHFRLLKEDIGPLVMFVGPYNLRYILVKINPEINRMTEILSRIKEVWKQYAAGTAFSYEFLDDAYDRNYTAEQEMEQGFKYFTFLGILISCLGLVGLVSAITEQKRKEIGIRKVLGATVGSILRQTHKGFLGPILLSNLIAWPVTYWAMSKWFQGFAYHTNMPLVLFPAASISILSLALLTVSGLSIRAARANPTESLRYE